MVTGSGGLIGSESVRHLVKSGHDVIGLENDMRAQFFGPSASTARTTQHLVDEYPGQFRSLPLDIRDTNGVMRIVREHAGRGRAQESS
ncbi:MAG: GDP-mannose 4,6-dehydratase, partial [Actinobacteria bacterium]|nr:GDP-mannose 4,6-dehydratase [Actinomycetota bacterium]